jgi:molecular chaperone DnaJ
VKIPAGVADGQRIRLAGKGVPGERGGPAGDLYVRVHVRAHELFGRKGDDLTLTLPVTFPEAALGTTVRVPTMDGAVTLKIPAGTASGRTFRVRGRGVPKRSGGAGDLLVTAEVAVPKNLPADAKEDAGEVRGGPAGRPAAADHRGGGRPCVTTGSTSSRRTRRSS